MTKDADFSDLCVLRGFPPKVIWIRRGNCTTVTIEQILRRRYDDIKALDADPLMGVLTLLRGDSTNEVATKTSRWSKKEYGDFIVCAHDDDDVASDSLVLA